MSNVYSAGRSIDAENCLIDAIIQATAALRLLRQADGATKSLIPQAPIRPTSSGELDVGAAGVLPNIQNCLPQAQPADSFRNSGFLSRWRPGKSVSIYVAGCTGARYLARVLGHPVYKIGTSLPSRLARREQELRDSRYASVVAGSTKSESGYDDWQFQKLPAGVQTSPGAPIQIAEKEIRIQLPAEMTLGAFERTLRQRLRPISLDQWAQSETIGQHLHARGVDLCITKRESHFQHGSEARRARTSELYAFRLRDELSSLVRVSEGILLEGVIGSPSPAADRPLSNEL